MAMAQADVRRVQRFRCQDTGDEAAPSGADDAEIGHQDLESATASERVMAWLIVIWLRLNFR